VFLSNCIIKTESQIPKTTTLKANYHRKNPKHSTKTISKRNEWGNSKNSRSCKTSENTLVTWFNGLKLNVFTVETLHHAKSLQDLTTSMFCKNLDRFDCTKKIRLSKILKHPIYW